MNNNSYGRTYIPNYNNFNQQTVYDQIDNQINQLQQMKKQMENNNTQTPAINQTFQLAPTNTHQMRYSNTIDDVIKETVYCDTPFFSNDMSILWIKNAKGDIKTYELNEIVPKDTKDLQIEYLQTQIQELKGMIENDASFTNVNAEQDATDTSKYDEPVRTTTKKTKSTSIQKVSGSKK